MTARTVSSASAISIVLLMTAIHGLALTPKTDRNSNPSAVGRRNSRARHKSRTVISLLLMVVLAIGMMTILAQQPKELYDTPSESPIPARITYFEHAPILINGNADFLGPYPDTGISGGSGTEGDPYVICDLDIDSSGKTGIDVRNSDVHFIIRNCYIHGKPAVDYGIVLYNVTNGSLVGNSLSHNHGGMLLVLSRNCTFSNNTCNSNDVAIWIGSMSDCVISNNTCSSNGEGIELSNSNNCTISGNTCLDNSFSSGINLIASSNCTIENNNCSSNQWGIIIHRATLDNSSRNNIVTQNVLYANVGYGIRVYDDSSNNRVWNNTFYHNNGAGEIFDPLHVQALGDGTDNWWNSSDGYGNNWSDWRGPDLYPMDGIVDYPYPIDGSSGSLDYYPIAEYYGTMIPEFGMTPIVVMVFLVATVITIGARRRKAS